MLHQQQDPSASLRMTVNKKQSFSASFAPLREKLFLFVCLLLAAVSTGHSKRALK